MSDSVMIIFLLFKWTMLNGPVGQMIADYSDALVLSCTPAKRCVLPKNNNIALFPLSIV
jgi:hypothetical protein